MPEPVSRMPGAIDGLIFDACNILYDDTAWRRWLLRLLVRLGLRTSYCCFYRIFDRDYLADVHRGRREFGEAMEEFLLSVGLSCGQAEEVRAACQSRRRDLDASLRPLTGVRDTLRQLQNSGMTLGVLCNSEHSADATRSRLESLLAGFVFPVVVSSRDLGRTMPDRQCYEAAIEAMNLPRTRVAFVGHAAAELRGAAAAGLATIAFNYDPDARADATLHRFEELFALPRRAVQAGAA
jgi:FMN phosphatase YigB (HAD superfamily)